jgi:hypothetical protein
MKRFLLVVLVCSTGCRDVPTAPEPLQPPGSALRSVTQGPFTIPIPPESYPGGGGLGWTNTGMRVPAWTSYVVTVSGNTTVSANQDAITCNPASEYYMGAVGSYGPAGTWWHELAVSVGFYWNGNDSPGTVGLSDTLFAWDAGVLAVSRSPIAGATNGSGGCVEGLYLLSSGQTVSLETFDGKELTVTPSSVAVRRGTAVTFTATSQGSIVPTPNWRFDVDSGVTNETTACVLYSGPNPCTVTVMNSGKLRVSKDVQGRMRAAVANVQVYTSFDLTADRTQVPAGETVSFTPLLDGAPGEASKWRWRGDSTDVPNPCAAIVNHVCQYAPAQSGTMWAYTAESGGDSASVHVTVVPCPTTDSLLDTLSIRDSLASFWVNTNASDSIPESHREQKFVMYRNPITGEVFARGYYNTLNSTCESTFPFGRPNIAQGDPPDEWIVAFGHFHPFHHWDVFRCPRSDGTNPLVHYDAVSHGGPSARDWMSVETERAPTTDGAWRKIPEYVIDADSIYRAEPGMWNGGTYLQRRAWSQSTLTCH